MKVFVGLSGGVDSAVAAHLLQSAGHEVTGVFLRTWQPAHVPCTQAEDERSAFAVAAHLRIPFLTYDVAEVYRKEVGQRFIDGYARGETPNPDVLCNREVKFGAFLQFAKARGADAVATGHYAKIVAGVNGLELHRGVDPDKDQSYFLSMLAPELLSGILFPLGELRKEKVREIAAAIGLPNATRRDSQGICFIGQVDLYDFLSPFVSLRPGEVLDHKGMVIGEHRGAPLYTVGERHGFLYSKKRTSDEPLYVIATSIAENTVTVAPKEMLRARSTILIREPVVHTLDERAVYQAQVRYHGRAVGARVTTAQNGYNIEFEEPIVAANGQSCVLYSGERLALSGILTG